MVSFDELEDAFERGREVGRREGLPFRGLPRVAPLSVGAAFRFERSWIHSFIAYERSVTEQLREVQRWRWIERRAGSGSERDVALERLQQLVLEELRAVRDAVDEELATGRGRACVVQAMRRAPNRPNGVLEYRDVEAFVAEDPRRARRRAAARRRPGIWACVAARRAARR